MDDLIGWDFYNNDKDPQHSSGSHGTKVAGMVAAEGDNSIGVAGVSWNSKLMPTRVGAGGSIYLDDAIEGIGYAADNGADVINMSWAGHGTTSGDLKDALDYAYDTKDLVLVSGASNDTDSLRNRPAEYSKVIAVAALYENDTKRSNSCWGSWIDVSAPGHILWSTYYDYSDSSHTYAQVGATSIASPQVAGLAALIKSVDPTLENWMIRNIITGTTDNIDAVNPSYVGLLGTGRINSYNAMQIVSNAPPAVTISGSVVSSHPRISWSAPSGVPDIDEYEVWRYRTVSGGGYTLRATVTGTTYTDNGIAVNKIPPFNRVYYKVKVVDYSGNKSGYSNEKWFYDGSTSKPIATSDESTNLPTKFSLKQNYPNPFNPVTKIKFDLPEESQVELYVYNSSGQVIAKLLNKRLAAGGYSVDFSAEKLSSGVYFYRIKTGQFTDVKRMLVIK